MHRSQLPHGSIAKLSASIDIRSHTARTGISSPNPAREITDAVGMATLGCELFARRPSSLVADLVLFLAQAKPAHGCIRVLDSYRLDVFEA
jgi:hypothetical protein